MNETREDQPVWQRQIVIAGLIILVFPLGLFLMWRYAPWRNAFKWLWTIIVLVVFVLAFVRLPSEEPGSSGATISVDSPPTAFL